MACRQGSGSPGTPGLGTRYAVRGTSATMKAPPPPTDLASLATLACILEASAPKPGNVSPGRPFLDMSYSDFVSSAIAAGPELARAGERPLGATILAAILATRRWTSANTNLGLVLLLAPLVMAVRRAGNLREALGAVLRETTVEDARDVYAAIREVGPGGMGSVRGQDIAAEPTVSLYQAMQLAADRDSIAREYVTDFVTTFEYGVPLLRSARGEGLAWDAATVETFLGLLSRVPDTLIARKLGTAAAELTSRQAAVVLGAGGVRTPEGRSALAAFDADLRDPQNSRNPGTTADLTAAALFVVLLLDGWSTDRSRTSRAQ